MWVIGICRRTPSDLKVLHRAHVARGFTLVEVIISVAIMALASAVLVPAMGGLGRSELRSTARKIAGTMRRTFDDAALSGRTERMVLTMGDTKAAKVVTVEATQDTLTFEGRDGALLRAVEPNALDDDSDTQREALGDNAVPDSGGSADAAMGGELLAGAMPNGGAARQMFGAARGINQLAQQEARITYTLEGTIPLPAGVHVLDVLTDGMAQPAQDGTVHLVFFPHGYTQKALIHLEDSDKNMMSIRIEALTGKAWVQEGYASTLDEPKDSGP